MSRRRLIFAGHLDRYVWTTYLASLATAFLMILGMFLIVDMAERMGDLMRDVDGVRPSLWTIGRYYVIRLPFIYLEVAPFVTLIAALFTVSKLMRHNEMTAMLAAGQKRRQMRLHPDRPHARPPAAMRDAERLV